MSVLKNRFVPFAVAATLAFAIAGCQSTQHRMTEPQAGTRIACQECYDQTKKVTGFRGTKFTRKVHGCSGCQMEMSIYTEDGVPKMKCAKCAPEGVACDKCLPPDSSGK